MYFDRDNIILLLLLLLYVHIPYSYHVSWPTKSRRRKIRNICRRWTLHGAWFIFCVSKQKIKMNLKKSKMKNSYIRKFFEKCYANPFCDKLSTCRSPSNYSGCGHVRAATFRGNEWWAQKTCWKLMTILIFKFFF